MQHYSYGVYLVPYKYTSSNRHNTDTRTKSLPRLAGVLFRALSHNAFTTVAAHNRKPVTCFSVSKSGPHHPREPTALENFNRVDTALIGEQASRDMEVMNFNDRAQRVNRWLCI